MNKQKKKYLNITLIIAILVSSFYMPSANAATSYIINTNNTPIKTLPNGGGVCAGYWCALDIGDAITLVDGYPAVASTNPACQTSYYFIKYDNTSGYVCGNAINFTSTGTYDAEFRAMGFPESYLPKLNVLKTSHPNWVFNAVLTNADWNEALTVESVVGKSLIQTNYQGYLSLDGGSYDYYTDIFTVREGTSWYAANAQTVGYYMDPRNFLNSTDILMFEKYDYIAPTTVVDGVTVPDTVKLAKEKDTVKGILANTFMNGTYIDRENDPAYTTPIEYAQTIMNAAATYGISPYLIASRMKQEVAVGTTGFSSIVSGTVVGYENLYNYFNIGAYPTEASDSITNGLNRAKIAINPDETPNPWNTRTKSILAGAAFLKNGYIEKGQNTLYMQKWDLVGELYGHQYMTNIMAPKSEAKNIYNSYVALGVINLPIIIEIPVFKNMPDQSAGLPNQYNPNNYLKTLTVDGKMIDSFDGAKTDYSYLLPAGVSTIGIDGTKVSTKSSVIGLGSKTIIEKEQTEIITVTSQSGVAKNYNIKFIRPDENPISPDEVINNMKYVNDGTYISKIAIGTNVDTISPLVKGISMYASVVIKDANGNVLTNIVFGTGDKVVITSNNVTKEYTSIIYGDVNGDGIINIVDLLRTQKIILTLTTLSEPYLKAADVNKDGKVDIADLLKVQKKILGLSDIEQ